MVFWVFCDNMPIRGVLITLGNGGLDRKRDLGIRDYLGGRHSNGRKNCRRPDRRGEKGQNYPSELAGIISVPDEAAEMAEDTGRKC